MNWMPLHVWPVPITKKGTNHWRKAPIITPQNNVKFSRTQSREHLILSVSLSSEVEAADASLTLNVPLRSPLLSAPDIPEEINQQTTVRNGTCMLRLHGCQGRVYSPTGPSGIGLLPWSSLHGTSPPSCYCLSLSVLSHSSSTCATAVLGITMKQVRLSVADRLSIGGGVRLLLLCNLTTSSVQIETPDLYISVALKTNNKKHNDKKKEKKKETDKSNYWLCYFCSFALMSFEVNVCQMSE